MITTMMRSLSVVLFFVALAAPAVDAQKTLSASKAWVRSPDAGATTTTAFVVVDNPTMYDVYLVSAQSDAAASVTFQKPGASADAKPQAVENVTAPAYDSVELKPDGVHLLLSGLKKPLQPGDVVTLVLTTDGGIALEAEAVVKRE